MLNYTYSIYDSQQKCVPLPLKSVTIISMETSKFSFALVFSVIILLAYSYIMFLGMVYWQNGKIVLPAVLAAAFIAVVLACVIVMCKAKATRWKRIGNLGQVLFGTIILVAFLFSAAPFTNFMDVLGKKGTFETEINNVMTTAEELDSEYMAYAEERLDNYERRLESISAGKNIRPTDYEQYLGRAGGSTDREKIHHLTNSLRMKLLPDSLTDVQIERENWLMNASRMSVWNVMLPSNIAKINAEVSRWTDNYIRLSENTYEGEEAAAFQYPQFKTSLQTLTDQYVKLHVPSLLAILLALLCFFIMLLPYWITERDAAAKETGVLYE